MITHKYPTSYKNVIVNVVDYNKASQQAQRQPDLHQKQTHLSKRDDDFLKVSRNDVALKDHDGLRHRVVGRGRKDSSSSSGNAKYNTSTPTEKNNLKNPHKINLSLVTGKTGQRTVIRLQGITLCR